MKILFIGNFASWMNLHLEHMIDAYKKAGCKIMTADYHDMAKWHGIPLPEKMAYEQQQRSLEQIVRKYSPDVCFFAGSIHFDLKRLKSYWNGIPVFHDYDGPRRSDLEWFCELSKDCLFLTVSRYIEREMRKRNFHAVYLPHGTDTEYYNPAAGLPESFAADASFIGRATDRRVKICSSLDQNIALYGERWQKTDLADMCRLKRDVYEKEVVSIYRDSTAMINILQEPLNQFQTILSLQCFAIPSAGGCLCAEYVEEFPEAFEDGKEVLLFRTPEEMKELLQKTAKDKNWAKQIGLAGRTRCLNQHTHFHRAETLLKLIS